MFNPGIWWIGLTINLSGADVQISDVFVGCEPAERLEPAGEVGNGLDVGEVHPKQVVAVAAEAFRADSYQPGSYLQELK